MYNSQELFVHRDTFDTFFDDTMMPYYNLKGNIHGKALGIL